MIRTGDLPVLVVARPAARPYRQPVLAVDLEDTGRAVAAVALRVFGLDVAAATLLHAYHVPFEGVVMPGLSVRERADLRNTTARAAEAGLAKLRSSLGDVGVQWHLSVVRGDPRTAILTQAVRRRADLLAVGTHGRAGVAHALLGSVAEWLVRAAVYDVLVARPARVSFKRP